MNRSNFIEKAAQWAEGRGFKKIKANFEEFETPSSFNRPDENLRVTPDATGLKRGRKSYFEVMLKTTNPRRKVSKIKLLNRLASMRGGKLFLLAPKGHKAFVQRIVSRHNLYNAEIVSLQS